MAHIIANPTTLTNLQSEWAGVVKMLEEMKTRVRVNFATSTLPSRGLAGVLYNLPMLLAFDVLKKVLQAAGNEGTVVWPKGKWMDSAKIALTWNNWDELNAGVDRRNEIAHDGKLFGSSQCLKDITNVQEQLVAWAIIDAG